MKEKLITIANPINAPSNLNGKTKHSINIMAPKTPNKANVLLPKLTCKNLVFTFIFKFQFLAELPVSIPAPSQNYNALVKSISTS